MRQKSYSIQFSVMDGGYVIIREGFLLRNPYFSVRVYKTRNSARKRISRERRGNFHA